MHAIEVVENSASGLALPAGLLICGLKLSVVGKKREDALEN